MRHRAPIAGIVATALCLMCRCGGDSSTAQPPPGPHRSPIDVAILGDGRFALVANHTADSISLVDLEGRRVATEKRVGRKPVAIAVAADGRRAAVSNLWSASVTLLHIDGESLVDFREIHVGNFPRGIVFAPAGDRLFVAVAGEDEVAEIDCAAGKVTRRWSAPREPRQLALSGDGKWLAAASSRSAQVRCWNLESGRLHWERDIADAFNLRGLSFSPENDAVICAHVVRRDFPVTKKNIEEGWVTDSRLTRLALKAEGLPNSWQIALDTFGLAVGDPAGVAFADRGKTLAVAASGTHELILFDAPAIPWNAGDPGDFLDEQFRKDKHLRRVELGGRPIAVRPRNGGEQLVIANYLLDAVQIVDAKQGTIVRTIALGSPKEPSLARRGETLFHDARRSHNQWFSCHTCHVDGHTCGLTFDTLNDDSYGTPKLTPSLRNVTHTGPWTWHGGQKDLGAGIAKSMTTTLFGPPPTRDETTAMLAFLETLVPPPRQASDDPAVRRGKTLFFDKLTCSRCHRGDYYTSSGVYDVKLESPGSPYKLWNPPSLLGVYDRGPFLHDGRANSLDDLLLHHHTSEMFGGPKLSDNERADLIAFLRSL
jgi:cytochrome c peroxidase